MSVDELSKSFNLPSSMTPRQADMFIPKASKDSAFLSAVEEEIASLPTEHRLIQGDARNLKGVEDESVHLVVTSPPYWTLKKYNITEGQLGYVTDYEDFLKELDKVWAECHRVLVEGGRLIIVVGDVCLSRRKHGRHQVFPLHADIQGHCRKLGFDNLAPIFWYKIANAAFEAEGNGAGFLGKPYEPGGVVKNDVEFILMERKPGSYRKPDTKTRLLSIVPADKHRVWFQQIWADVPGESTAKHPAPFPLEIPLRLIRMFSFAGDTVLDPFTGTGTTNLAAMKTGRNSVGFEIDSDYLRLAEKRIRNEIGTLQMNRRLSITKK
ncbi:MAG: site-specific DNA-methyltransferase [Candidatus Thermoplasmatota archaeon]